MVLTDTRRPTVQAKATHPDFAYGAFWLLRIAFGVLPIVVGIDKYFDKAGRLEAVSMGGDYEQPARECRGVPYD